MRALRGERVDGSEGSSLRSWTIRWERIRLWWSSAVFIPMPITWSFAELFSLDPDPDWAFVLDVADCRANASRSGGK